MKEPLRDSKAWGQAYAKYKQRYPLSTLTAGQKRSMKKKAKKFGKEIHNKYNRDHYQNTVLGYKWWRSTEAFDKWSKAQYMRQGGSCYYCDIPLSGIKENVEHIVPKSKGGTNKKSNLVLSCSDCNKQKNTRTLTLKERERLAKHNRLKDRSMKTPPKNMYPSEIELAMELRDMLREE